MEMICPDCLGRLVMQDRQSAHCTVHGGDYQVLFSRWQPAPVTPPPAPSVLAVEPAMSAATTTGYCGQHPTVAAEYSCVRCGAEICFTCAFLQTDGSQLCSTCASAGQPSEPRLTLAPYVPLAPRAAVVLLEVPVGVRCVQHPDQQACFQCKLCGAFLCQTCDFPAAGGYHVCPPCATAPRTGLSSRRRKLVIWSYVLAVWATLATAVLLSGLLESLAETENEEEALGGLLTFGLLIPAIVGLALGCSAFDRRLNNPMSVWVAAIWNGLIAVLFILLCIIGLMM